MSEGWYCSVFGAELGPMSWDDLVQIVSHGQVGPRDRVRRGTSGQWQPASAVEGLLAAAAERRSATTSKADDPSATAWCCEVLGAELGPMPWSDLREMARRGALAPKNRVRREHSAEWVLAETVEGLMPAASHGVTAARPSNVPDEDADFEVDAAATAPRAVDDSDFEFAGPLPAAPSRDDEYQVSAPATSIRDEPQPTAPADQAKSGAIAQESSLAAVANSPPPVSQQPAARTETASVAPEPVVTAKPDEKKTDKKKAEKTKPEKKKAEKKKPEKTKPEKKKPEKRKSAASRPKLEITPGQLKALAALVGVCCLVGVGYLVFVSLGSRSSADYDAILAGYDRLQNEVNTAKQNRGAGMMPDAQMQFVNALNGLRKPLENAEPGSINDRLYRAGTHLVEMLANAGAPPESDAELQYRNSEKSYQDLMTSVRGELGK